MKLGFRGRRILFKKKKRLSVFIDLFSSLFLENIMVVDKLFPFIVYKFHACSPVINLID
jgi:hypothetical protein